MIVYAAVDGLVDGGAEGEGDGDGARLGVDGGLAAGEVGAEDVGGGVDVEAQAAIVIRLTTINTAKNSFLK